MNKQLDSTLHVYDNEKYFYLVSKDKNLKLVLSDEQKTKVYEVLKMIEKNKNIEDFSDDPFKNQVIQLLSKHNFYREQSVKKEKIKLNFEVFGPLAFLNVLKETIDGDIVISETYTKFISKYDRQEEPITSYYIHLIQDRMYITNEMWTSKFTSNSLVNNNIEVYAAYVFLEKFKNQLLEPEKLNYIDLSFYTNKLIVLNDTDISAENFKESILNDKYLMEYQIEFDFKNYFPFVLMKVNYLNGKVLRIFGFNEIDAYNNFLSILKENGSTYKIYLKNPEIVEEMKNEDFVKKLISLYLGETLDFEYLDDIFILSINNEKYEFNLKKDCNIISYALTTVLNKNIKKEMMIYEA